MNHWFYDTQQYWPKLRSAKLCWKRRSLSCEWRTSSDLKLVSSLSDKQIFWPACVQLASCRRWSTVKVTSSPNCINWRTGSERTGCFAIESVASTESVSQADRHFKNRVFRIAEESRQRERPSILAESRQRCRVMSSHSGTVMTSVNHHISEFYKRRSRTEVGDRTAAIKKTEKLSLWKTWTLFT